jgi:hypothetical protein
MRDINRMTAGESTFGATAVEEDEHACKITSSLDNLANALIQKNSTIDNLVATNAQLAQAIEQMQAAMTLMFSTGQAPPGPTQAWLSVPPAVMGNPTAYSPSLIKW